MSRSKKQHPEEVTPLPPEHDWRKDSRFMHMLAGNEQVAEDIYRSFEALAADEADFCPDDVPNQLPYGESHVAVVDVDISKTRNDDNMLVFHLEALYPPEHRGRTQRWFLPIPDIKDPVKRAQNRKILYDHLNLLGVAPPKKKVIKGDKQYFVPQWQDVPKIIGNAVGKVIHVTVSPGKRNPAFQDIMPDLKFAAQDRGKYEEAMGEMTAEDASKAPADEITTDDSEA
jgi:hypothetical protein